MQAEAFAHEALEAGFVEEIVGEFFVGEHGEGGAFGAGGECLARSCTSATPEPCQATCAPGELCSGTRCLSSLCTDEQRLCATREGTVGTCCGVGGACVDFNHDALNCGTCGNVCAAGQTCAAGACQ